MQVDWISGWG